MEEKKVVEWLELKAKLDSIKEEEMDLRKEICDHILAGKLKGSKKGKIGKYSLTAAAKLNQSVDKELLHSMWKELTPEEKSCFKFTPSVVAKELKNIPSDSIINRAIETKPGAPALTFNGIIKG